MGTHFGRTFGALFWGFCLSPTPSRQPLFSEGLKGGRRKGGRGRKLSHFSFCCAFRCCVVYSPCFPVWGEEKVMTIYAAAPLAAGPLCGLLFLETSDKGNFVLFPRAVRCSEIGPGPNRQIVVTFFCSRPFPASPFFL